ncbi:hypothetical protein AgCh_013190 [Apium graveolens]
MTLDEVYGMLKIHDLEIQQRKNRKDTDDVSYPDTNNNEDSEIDMDDPQVVEMAAMLVKGFRRMRFRKPQRKGGFNRRFSGQGKDRFRKNDGQYNKERKFENTKVTCYKYNERGYLANECRKTTGKALVTTNSNRDWMDSSGTDNDDECYAFMAAHGENASGTDKVPLVIFPVDIDNLSELKTFLYSLNVTFKGKTTECDSLIANNKRLKERKEFLEAENINKSINNTTPVKFVGTDERGVESVYEFGSTSKNNAEEKDEPRVPAKNKEDPKMKEKKSKNIGLLSKSRLDKKICEINSKAPKTRVKNVKTNPDRVNPDGSNPDKSGCSAHMTGTKSLLSEYEEKAGLMVSYGDDNVGKILGYGNIIIGNVIISNVALVDGLKHNLLSIRQITDRVYEVLSIEQQTDLQFFQLETIIEEERREKEVERRQIEALKLKENIISLATTISWIYRHRALKSQEVTKKMKIE